ncbi:MAG: molybdopterin-dependent oxidoreductase [Solirubrobacterales bacterium]|nr:molybdopterin-dependent oxidoreductase [Solirubrobacterales bacterium]MBV9680917.1 molybdopterin-dependent oxidoreductase [Solirubrobacterales bacterium]
MKAVGARLPRYDGVAHVTARSVYVDDVRVPGTLVAKALRSPHHHAAIKRIDTARAKRLSGVRGVVTHEDVPNNVYGHLEALGIPADEPLLAENDVRYRGQPIAAVAAEDSDTALEALDAIEIEYEERPALFDMRNALDPDAPRMHHWGGVYPHFGPHNHRRVRKGDVEWAFDQADVIVEGVYRPQAIEHCPLETQVALVVPEAGGRLTIYSCTQAMYFSLGVVAAHLEVPLNRLKFVGGTVGGGFGGKVDTASETIAALLALKSRRPVKWRWTREEEFLASSTRAPWHIEIADAVTSDGWVLGRRTVTLHDSGAYARFSPYGVTKHAFHHTGAYTIPNLRFDGFVVFTNRVPTTAMRGFGVTSVSMAVELHMTRIAEVLGISPWELRLKNANRIGDTTANRVAMQDPSTVPVTLAAAERVGEKLGPEYAAMTADRRSGDLLPEHLVAQQAPEGAHVLGNGGGS